MIVRPDQLAEVISRQAYPVYMVSGDEPLQHMEALDTLRNHLREHDFTEREVLDVDASFDWSRLAEEAATLSLFATRRIIELRLPTARPGKQGAGVLKDYLAKVPEDTVLIINAGKLDGSSKKSAWFKAVDRAGIVVQVWPVPPDRLGAWLMSRFRRLDMVPDREALSYVSQHVEGNLLAADQEISKLHLLLGPGDVSYADVAEAITSQSRYDVFELVDVILRGDGGRAFRVLNGLRAEDVAIQVVLWAVVKDLRLLVSATMSSAAPEMVLRRKGVWQSRIELFNRCLSRHRAGVLQNLLRRCAVIDAAGKGVADLDAWSEMESVSLRLAGRSR